MEKPVKKVREQGTCPYCGSDDIEWRGAELEDELMFYNAMCNNCERDFVEVYKLEYDGYDTYDENGEEHLFDKEGNEMGKVTTICHGEKREWASREGAYGFFYEAMLTCEDSFERYRYATIVCKLISGLKVCSDED